MTQYSEHDVDVTVVIICYNQEKYVAETLESVLAQTALDRIREIILVDDCSSDGSVAAAQVVAQRDPRIRVVARDTNSGGCSSPRNDGIMLSHGSHIAFLDGDDLWLPEKLQEQLKVLDAHPEVGLLFSDYTVFDDETGAETSGIARHYELSDQDQLKKFFVNGGPIIPSCAVISRAAVEEIGLFDPEMRFNEDSEYWMRIASVAPIHHQALPLIRKREWFGSLGSTKYGLENLECKHEITRRMVALMPELSEVVAKRDAQLDLKTAVYYFAIKERGKARGHLRAAIALNPRLAKARLYLLLSFLWGDPETLIDMVRKARTLMPAALR